MTDTLPKQCLITFDSISDIPSKMYRALQRLTVTGPSVMREAYQDIRKWEKIGCENFRRDHAIVVLVDSTTGVIFSHGIIYRESNDDCCMMPTKYKHEAYAYIWTNARMRGRGYGKIVGKQLFSLSTKLGSFERLNVFGTKDGKLFWKSVEDYFNNNGSTTITDKLCIL